jgi:hypothetical protein
MSSCICWSTYWNGRLGGLENKTRTKIFELYRENVIWRWRVFWALYNYTIRLIFFVRFWRDSPQWARASLFTRFLDHTYNDAPQSVGLLWTSDQLVAETSTWQHTTLTTDIHAPGGIRTHNLNRRAAEDLRLRPCGHRDRHSPNIIKVT